MAPTARNDIATRAYFDAATAAPLHPVARQAMSAALDDGWADPGRLYTEARRAAQLLDAAREVIAECLGTRPDEIAFCASGSHAAQLAIDGVRDAPRRGRCDRRPLRDRALVGVAGRPTWPIAATVAVDRLGHVDMDALVTAVAEPARGGRGRTERQP